MSELSVVMRPGPWEHRQVPSNGARFHVVTAGPADGDGPLVVLLHDFPQLWWAWRHQLGALAEAGHRVAAIDLRGFGGSDKPPHGHDVPTLAADVAGVIGSLGEARAVVVGHGLGGLVAWSLPMLHPDMVSAVAVLGMPHPVAVLRLRNGLSSRAIRLLAAIQVPWFPERALRAGDLVERVLRDGSAPGRTLDPVEVAAYREAIALPFAAHCTLEHLRWLVRSTPRVTGRRYLADMAAPVRVPVLSVRGARDGYFPARAFDADAAHTATAMRVHVIPDAGHFLPEEAPEEVSDQLLDFLATLAGA
ncbi:MAG TPA: alpha/beta hydrolase [Actinomycetaceae bacterium]|nr:alpha/beta hydrolase [Actinomycetaceae bacterium]